ncbi:MAG: thiamine phosphate synthase [Pseudomonadota bacterium]
MGLKHQAASARKWRAAIRQVETHFPEHLPPLLFLTDPDRIADPTLIIDRLPTGSGVIYRHFGAPDRQQIAEKLCLLCRRRDLYLMIAADPHLARSIHADGVHWPERLLCQSRKWRGRFALQTASAHSVNAVRRAASAGMDAALLSTVFLSSSKSAGSPIGVTRFRRLSHRTDIPVYALGGVSATNAQSVATVGGLATVTGVSTANSDS